MKLIGEAKNKSVFTTRFVVEANAPVIYVHYDKDGDWQIFGPEILTRRPEKYDPQLVSAEQILAIEPWLTTLPDLQPGQALWRDMEKNRHIITDSPDDIPDCFLPEEGTPHAVRASAGDMPEEGEYELLPEWKWLDEAGIPIHDTVAMRGSRIVADRKRVRKYDFHAAESRILCFGYLLTTVLLLGGAIWLYAAGHWIWGLLPSLISLLSGAMAIALYRAIVPNPYESGALVPGIVTDPELREVVVLADVATVSLDDMLEKTAAEERPREQWACRRMRMKQLSPHQLKVGERVPCVALFGSPNEEKERYELFNPYPLAWATGDPEAIRREERRIDSREWDLLCRMAAVVIHHEPEIRENQLAFFDEACGLMDII